VVVLVLKTELKLFPKVAEQKSAVTVFVDDSLLEQQIKR